MIFATQLGIVAFGIIFAFGGILYTINYDFTPILTTLYDTTIHYIQAFRDVIPI